MIALQSFSELVHLLYSAPLDDDQWQHFLVLLSQHTQSKVSVFLCADNHLGVLCRALGGSSPRDQIDIPAYNQRYVQNDPFRAPCLRDPRPRIVQGDDLLPNQGLLRTAMYRDLLEPQQCRYATLLLLTLSVRRIEIITIWRSPQQGPIDNDCNQLLHLLFPHIRKALEIRQVLGHIQQRLAAAEAVADASSSAAFLLTRQGEIVYRNAAADHLLTTSACLTAHDGVLRAAPDSRRALQELLLLTAQPHPDSTAPAAMPLPRAGSSRPLQLIAAPLPRDLALCTRAELLLLVTDPDAPVSFPDPVLRSLYGLSPAEIEIANGLLMGFSIQEIASLRGVTQGTARFQLKQIFAKTDTSSQADLLRLFLSLPGR